MPPPPKTFICGQSAHSIGMIFKISIQRHTLLIIFNFQRFLTGSHYTGDHVRGPFKEAQSFITAMSTKLRFGIKRKGSFFFVQNSSTQSLPLIYFKVRSLCSRPTGIIVYFLCLSVLSVVLMFTFGKHLLLRNDWPFGCILSQCWTSNFLFS